MRLSSKNLRSTLALVASGVTLATAGFFAGRSWPREPTPIVISQPPPPVLATTPAAQEAPATEAGEGDAEVATAPFVASKSGNKYHPSEGCSYADRIKPENRVFFKTEKDAQAAGLEPSSCISK